MRTLPTALWPLGVAALLSWPLSLHAQAIDQVIVVRDPAPASSPPEVISPVLKRAPTYPAPAATDLAVATNPTSERARPMSSTTAAKLAEKMPRFVPPKPAPGLSAAVAAEESPADLREIDKPRNTIVRLPKFMVMEDKPPTFKEREILTPKGHLNLAYKRYAGLKIGNLPFFSNDGLALAMLEEDRILERAAEMRDLVSLLPTSKIEKAK